MSLKFALAIIFAIIISIMIIIAWPYLR